MEVAINHNVRSFYNTFFFIYPVINLFLEKQKKCLLREMNKVPSGDLLEIGVGNGSHIKFYYRHRFTGIDASREMIKSAIKKSNNQFALYLMDGEDMTFADNMFDYIIISHVLAVTTNPNKMLAEAYRTLRAGGKLFILNHFTPTNWLRFIDIAFNSISALVSFKSYFRLTDLHALQKFRCVKEINSSWLDYYKVLVCTK